MTVNHKVLSEWKIQLIMRIIFVSFLDINETHIMYTKSDNIKLMSGTETNDVINKLLCLFLEDIRKN